MGFKKINKLREDTKKDFELKNKIAQLKTLGTSVINSSMAPSLLIEFVPSFFVRMLVLVTEKEMFKRGEEKANWDKEG